MSNRSEMPDSAKAAIRDTSDLWGGYEVTQVTLFTNLRFI